MWSEDALVFYDHKRHQTYSLLCHIHHSALVLYLYVAITWAGDLKSFFTAYDVDLKFGLLIF